MKILVTGANGYLGQGIVKQLLDDGIEVLATDIKSDYIDKRAHIMETNLFETENPYIFFEEPDVLLHLAWRDGFKHDSIIHINDLPKHYKFITKMAEKTPRIAIMGSMHEIGFWEGCIDENTPTNPMSLYGISKNALRQCATIMQNRYHFQLQWIRGFYIVSNDDKGSSIFSKISQAAHHKETTFPFTQGTCQYDFIEYDKFCRQVAAVVEQDAICGIINCCSGKPESLSSRVERYIQDNHYSIKLQYGAYKDRLYDSKALWGDNSLIQSIVNRKEKNGRK